MKRVLLFLVALSLTSVSMAFFPVWLSSHTETADTTQNLCKPQTSGQVAHADFHGVCIDSATAAASTFIVYAASGSANNMIVDIDATKGGCYYYDVEVSSGLTYSNSSTAHATVLYQCY